MAKTLEELLQVFERIKKYAPTSAEYTLQKNEELARQTSKFADALYYITLQQFGAKYVNVHTRDLTTNIEYIQPNIEELFLHGIGGFYSSAPGGGKTHILLEIFNQIAWLEWRASVKTYDFPNALLFIEKTCHYIYGKKMLDLLGNQERVPISKYNFIDDLGLGNPLPSVMTGMEGYFEEMNQRGVAMILSSNFSKEDLMQQKKYAPIGSRLCGTCDFYELGEGDRRQTEEKKPNPGWRASDELL